MGMRKPLHAWPGNSSTSRVKTDRCACVGAAWVRQVCGVPLPIDLYYERRIPLIFLDETAFARSFEGATHSRRRFH